jgi:hypothetical protein
MDVVAPPPVEAPADAPAGPIAAPADSDKNEEIAEKPKDEKPAAAERPTPPKPAKPGVAGAIVATVIIVLGLAALATYAYLKTK